MTTATEVELHPLIAQRWSPRAFAETPVPQELVDALLEAARWAPSCMNEQPWRFVVADRHSDPAAHAHVVSALAPANAVWASRAPLLLISVAHTAFTRNGTPNRWAAYDTGQAVAQMALEATARGIVLHQMGGFDVDALRAALGIPADYEPLAVIAAGYPGSPETLSEELRARESAPRQRLPLSDLVYSGAWGRSAGQHDN